MRSFITGICLTGVGLILAGCGKPTSMPNAITTKEHPLGIIRAERDGTMVVLTVVLKDQLKLLLRDGNTPGPMYWVRANTPTPVTIQLHDGQLSMGAFSQQWDTNGVILKKSFAQLCTGCRKVKIGTRDRDGSLSPVIIELIPTTADERRAIGKDELPHAEMTSDIAPSTDSEASDA